MAKAVLLHFVLQLCSVKARKRTYPRSYWPELAKGLCSLHFADMGRWWGTNPKTKQQEEIDIMAVQDSNSALFAECKWTNEKVDVGVLEKLIERSSMFSYKNKTFYIFAKSGFTKSCLSKAEKLSNVRLIEYSNMLT